MEFSFNEFTYIISITVSALVAFFAAKQGLRGEINQKFNKLNEDINSHVLSLTRDISDLKVDNEKLKSKIELQDQIVHQFQSQVLENLPQIYTTIMKEERKGGTQK